MWLNVFEELYIQRPDIKITVLASKRSNSLRDLASGYPYVNVQPMVSISSFKLAASLWAPKVIMIHPTFGVTAPSIKRAARVLRCAPHSKIVGFSLGKESFGDIILPYDIGVTYIENIAHALQLFGITPGGGRPTLRYVPDPQILSTFKLQPKRYVVVHPFGSNPKRSLPHSRWKTVLQHIKDSYPNHDLVVHIGPGERERAQDFTPAGVSIIGDNLHFAEAATLIENAAVYIGVDTGITHLAALIMDEVILIGNLSNPTWLPTYNPHVVILYNAHECSCKGDKSGDCRVITDEGEFLRCLYTIPDETLYTELHTMLERATNQNKPENQSK